MTIPLRPLGSTGITTSVIGLGTVKLGRGAGLKYPTPFAIPDDNAAIELLRRAAELGITLIDTAPAYGTSEERLGQLLPQAGGRDRWLIATKVGEEFDEASATSRYDFSPQWTTTSIERSLKRLRTDRLDVALVHSDGRDQDIIDHSGCLDRLSSLKRQGKIRAFGMSAKTPEGALAAVESCDVVMLTINPRDRTDLPAARLACEKGVGVLVKKALLSGHVGSIAEHLRDRADLARLDPAEASIRFALSATGVSSVIVGTLNINHLEQAVRAASGA